MSFYAELRITEGEHSASLRTDSPLTDGRTCLVVATVTSGISNTPDSLSMDKHSARCLMRVLQQYFRIIEGDPPHA